MTEEKIKAKAKEQFPNDEFKQQAVINAINWATKELQEQIEKMKCCGNCTKGNCVNIGQKGKACAYWTSNELREIKEK